MMERLFTSFGMALREPLAAALIGSAAIHLGAIALLVAMDRATHVTADTGGIVAVEIVVSDGPGDEFAGAEDQSQIHPVASIERPPEAARRGQMPAETIAHTPHQGFLEPLAERETAPPVEATESLRPEPAPIAEVLDPPPPPRPKPDSADILPDRSATGEAATLAPEHVGTDEPITAPETAVQQTSLPGAPSRGAAPLASNPSPAYPFRARLRGVEGRVLLRVEVNSDGRTIAVSIAESSGDASLDAAAEAAVRRWRFRPALRKGVHAADEVLVPVRFQLH